MPLGDDGLYTYSRTPVNNFKKGLHSHSKYNDPTYLGFTLLFDWDTPEEQQGYGGSPLLAGGIDESAMGHDPAGWTTKPGTAMDYLRRCGEYGRMHYLNGFIQTLKAVNYKMPWYFQEIEGLEAAWKYNHFKDPYIGGDDAMIKIKCLESIDLIMTKIMDLYKKACYDYEHRRVIIPENLRKFHVFIYVQEIRKFQMDKLFLQKLGEGLPKIPGVNEGAIGNKINSAFDNNPNANPNSPANPINSFFAQPGNADFQVVNEGGAKVIFGLEYCEFETDESSVPFGSLSNAGPGMAEQSIAFKYENLKKQSEYPFMEAELADVSGGTESTFAINKDNWKQKLESKGKQIAANAVNAAADYAKGKLAGLILGNVHGFSVGSVAAALEQGTIQGISSEIGQAVSGFGSGEDASISGTDNVYGDTPKSNNNISGEDNVFE